MEFHVGPYTYTLVISAGEMYDDLGCELSGLAVESQKLLILSHKLEPCDREGILYHEVEHAWSFHGATPSTEEGRCQLSAMIRRQFGEDLEQQGGREALEKLQPTRMGNIGMPTLRRTTSPPVPDRAIPMEVMGQPDRLPCATCEAPIMCGSIHHDAPTSDGSGKIRMLRWFNCEICGAVQVWWEYCDTHGNPLGVYVSVPRPRVLQGIAAKEWLKERRVAALV
jgi:hypothetical protein